MTAIDRLARLLALLPWLSARPGVTTAEAAAAFGVSEDQLVADVETLFVCGLPGYSPGDLIDIRVEGGRIEVVDDVGLSRPLRLTADEATAIVVALRSLAVLPGVADGTAVQGALAALERSAGEGATRAVAVSVDAGEGVAERVRDALVAGRRLHLRYYVESRDETTERDVDPMRLLPLGGFAYLEAWCRAVEGVRLFRLDRVEAVQVLDVPSEPPPQAQPRDLSAGAWTPAGDEPLVVLRLAPRAAWVAEYYPCESVEAHADGQRVSLRVSDDRWLRRLVLRSRGAVVPLEPAALRERVRADVEAALASARAAATAPASQGG